MTLETGVKALAEAVAVDVKALTDGKVDKELGKGLSESDYTQAEKTKLADIADEATKNRADSENADKVHTHTVEQVSGLGYAATAPTVGDGAEVMRSGAYGFGHSFPEAVINANEIADQVGDKSGFYHFISTDGSLNVPHPFVYIQQLFYLTTGNVTQIAYGYNIGATWVRYRFYGVWSPWLKQLTTNDILQTTGSSTELPMSQKATTDAIANIPPVPKSAAYTVSAADKGASIDTSAGVTIPASVFTVGDVIVVTNTGASSINITPASGVTFRLAGSASTGLRTLAGYGVATFRMVSSNVWFGSGTGLS